MIGFGKAGIYKPKKSIQSPIDGVLPNFNQVDLDLTIKELNLGSSDPFSVYRVLYPKFDNSFILESLTGPKELARYTFMGFDPRLVLTLDNGVFQIDGKPVAQSLDPITYLKTLLSSFKTNGELAKYKYIGGLVGYISYDFIRYLEKLPQPIGRSKFPDLQMGLFLDGLIHVSRENKFLYFSYGDDRSEEILDIINQPNNEKTMREFMLKKLGSDTNKDEFVAIVNRAKEYIRAGDIFQVVLSKKLGGRFLGDVFEVYKLLREINPSPYMYHLKFGDKVVVGSSPEMLVEVQNDVVSTYPIAGTRPMGKDDKETEAYQRELLSDEKELAEHNMLVDLARNDVGRVSRFGTVCVPEYITVKRFSHVQHIVSRVEGKLQDGKTALDALGAIFPAGTVSGAPKVRAMEIIDELEASPRGPYAGAIGYFSLNGNLDSCIGIRTLFTNRQKIYLQAGAGIVADSVGEREWVETDHKLEALKSALLPEANQGG